MTLREARRRRGMTQEQLEDAAGVAQTAISHIEGGRTKDPNWSTVIKLAKALKINPVDLEFAQ